MKKNPASGSTTRDRLRETGFLLFLWARCDAFTGTAVRTYSAVSQLMK